MTTTLQADLRPMLGAAVSEADTVAARAVLDMLKEVGCDKAAAEGERLGLILAATYAAHRAMPGEPVTTDDLAQEWESVQDGDDGCLSSACFNPFLLTGQDCSRMLHAAFLFRAQRLDGEAAGEDDLAHWARCINACAELGVLSGEPLERTQAVATLIGQHNGWHGAMTGQIAIAVMSVLAFGRSD